MLGPLLKLLCKVGACLAIFVHGFGDASLLQILFSVGVSRAIGNFEFFKGQLVEAVWSLGLKQYLAPPLRLRRDH